MENTVNGNFTTYAYKNIFIDMTEMFPDPAMHLIKR